METLASALPKEQARVREILALYKSVGAPGALAAADIERSLQRADRAATSGDVLAMLRAYEELRGIE